MSRNDRSSSKASGTASAVTPAEWLHLAATPTFAVMALLSGATGDGAMDMLCPVAHGMSPLGGMTVMYLLMAAFHAAPWLKMAPRGWRGKRRARS